MSNCEHSEERTSRHGCCNVTLNIRCRLSITELEGEESQGNRMHIAEMSSPIAEQLMNEVCDGKKVSVTVYVFWRTRQVQCRWLDTNA